MLTITTAATDRNLLTPEELRIAIGLAASDTSQDAMLSVAGIRAADIIAEYCKVGGDGFSPVTLLRETITETLRLACPTEKLILGRRFVVVSAITVDGEAVETTDFEVDASPGFVRRLDGVGSYCWWDAGVTVVTYQAGFVTAPSPLKEAASGMVRLYRARSSRDPLLKREDIVDVGEQEFWVGPIGSEAIPDDIKALLGPYRIVAVA